MVTSSWETLSDRQADCFQQTEEDLRDTERFIAARQKKDAKISYKIAEAGIDELRRLQKERRGRPRKELGFRIRFYDAWLEALWGGLDLATMGARSKMGIRALRRAKAAVNKLLEEQPDAPELTELIDKINRWQTGRS